jgi:hypothetical protein
VTTTPSKKKVTLKPPSGLKQPLLRSSSQAKPYQTTATDPSAQGKKKGTVKRLKRLSSDKKFYGTQRIQKRNNNSAVTSDGVLDI